MRLDVHLLDSNQSAFQEGRVRTALRAAYHVSTLRSVDRAGRQRGSGFSTALSPLQNLAAYIERQGIPLERRAVLMDYARRLTGEGTDGTNRADGGAIVRVGAPRDDAREPEGIR